MIIKNTQKSFDPLKHQQSKIFGKINLLIKTIKSSDSEALGAIWCLVVSALVNLGEGCRPGRSPRGKSQIHRIPGECQSQKRLR